MKSIVKIIDKALNDSIKFLNKSIILSNPDNVTKEENYREFNFIYHILFGSSRILKKASHLKTINDQ